MRTLSAIVMIAVAGTALWLGGWLFIAFVVAVGAGVIWEWWGLARRIASSAWGRAMWLLGGFGYVGVAMAVLIALRTEPSVIVSAPHPLDRLALTLQMLVTVIFVDVGAYFVGRTFKGPKIAPRISPSKTWSGLIGGMIFASIAFGVIVYIRDRITRGESDMPGAVYVLPFLTADFIAVFALVFGILIAIIAQSGDFFQSWMKRRAGVKDSGSLIPGHGGLFDRADGLLAVLFAFGLLNLIVIGNISPSSVSL